MNATPGRVGAGAFVAAGLAASVAGGGWQLAFAAVAIGLFGVLHGASDLGVAPRARWPALLTVYGIAVIVTLLWWRVEPVSALCAFLFLSGLHFALDDAPAERPGERWCRGVLMVAGPALLHRDTLAGLFAALTGAADASVLLAGGLAAAAVPALLLVPVVTGRQGRGLLAVGVAALVLLPPLVGFALAFTLLHARPQLAHRMAALGSESLPDYLRQTAPVLAGAGAVALGAAWLFVETPAPALSTLFAGLAALATPHMLAPAKWRPRVANRLRAT